MTKENTNSIDRRSVLKSLGAASSSAFVATSPVSAVESDQTRQELKKRAEKARAEYSDVETVRQALQEHTTEFIRGLHEEGYLPEVGLNQFKLGSVRTLEEVLNEGEGVTVDSLLTDGGFTVDITLHTSTQTGEMEIHTVPETGRTFAVENPRDEDLRTPIKQTSDGPSPAEFCVSDTGCVYTGSCGSDYYDEKDNIYNIDCCDDGSCYYTKTTECCTDGNGNPCSYC